MENKGLLKLPETWHIKLTDLNKETIKSYFEGFRQYDIGCAFGMVNGEIRSRIAGFTYGMGLEITFADFKRLVLGEKNADDYGVLGCEELAVYFRHNNIQYIEGWIKENIYYILSEWDYEDFENSKRQSLPLTEYLKLIEPETMEKKYEYKLRDENQLLAVQRIISSSQYKGENIKENGYIQKAMENLNVLDLFFEKVEVKELPIIGGERVTSNEDYTIIKHIAIHNSTFKKVKKMELINGTHVSESDVKQIREYLRK